MRYSVVTFTSPSSISEHLAVVPPTSKAMMFFSPTACPRIAAPNTPATGPDSTMLMGVRRACAKVVVPPLDCMMYRSPVQPISSRRLSRWFR